MKTNYKNFTISAKYTGSKKAPWDDGIKYPENWNHHTITVRNNETGKKTSFDFWASLAKPVLDSEYDLLNALYCFVSDSLSGMQDFNCFCNDFGYDTDSRTAERTWKACKRSAQKWYRVSEFSENETCDFLNELQEIAG